MFLPDSNRVSAATVASTAIAAAQWAVTQVWKSTVVTVISFHFIKTRFTYCHLFLFNGFIQTAQNGPSGGQGVDTALCQQVAAVSYSQEGNAFSGLDVAPFKPQTDVRVAALPGAGAAQMGMFPAGQFYDIWIWAGIKQACCDQICFSHVAAVSSEAVTPGSAVVQLLVPPAQSALLTTATTAPAPQVQFSFSFFLFFFFLFPLFHSITSSDFFTVSVFKQVEIVGKPQPATPSQPATPGTEHELQQYRKLCGKV